MVKCDEGEQLLPGAGGAVVQFDSLRLLFLVLLAANVNDAVLLIDTARKKSAAESAA